MALDLLLALTLFALVSSITPGPNNLMLLSSGVNFGFRRSIPHMLGVALGHAAMVFAIGIGLGEVFSRVPAVYTVLKILGALYMVYLAWKIAHSGPIEAGEGRAKPLTFLQAALFQWINPKGVVMAVSVVSLYTVADNYIFSVTVAAVVFLAVNLVATTTWTGFGVGLRGLLSDPRVVRWFNLAMAGLLLLSLIPMLWD